MGGGDDDGDDDDEVDRFKFIHFSVVHFFVIGVVVMVMWMLLASPRDLGGCAALCVDALWAGELRLGGGEVGMMMVVWAHTCWETEEKNSAPHRAAGSSPRAPGRERTGGCGRKRKRGTGTGSL